MSWEAHLVCFFYVNLYVIFSVQKTPLVCLPHISLMYDYGMHMGCNRGYELELMISICFLTILLHHV
jgi:hypothetical protein